MSEEEEKTRVCLKCNNERPEKYFYKTVSHQGKYSYTRNVCNRCLRKKDEKTPRVDKFKALYNEELVGEIVELLKQKKKKSDIAKKFNLSYPQLLNYIKIGKFDSEEFKPSLIKKVINKKPNYPNVSEIIEPEFEEVIQN